MRVRQKLIGFTTRVVVVDGANVEAEVSKGLLVAAVEVHLQVSARIASGGGHVRVPVAEVKAALMRIVEAALNGGAAKRFRDAAEPVVGGEGAGAGDRPRRGGVPPRPLGAGGAPYGRRRRRRDW